MNLDARQLSILQHTVGCDQYGRGCSDRNHFVTDESSSDGRVCLGLVAAGYMSNDGPRALCGGMSVFHVTRDGRQAMAEQSPSPPPEKKLSRSQRRYLDYIRADCGMSFREWMGFQNARSAKRKQQ